jgi:outer membrane lipopolysaccharide assembly protein LptE/RlpB
VTAASSGAPLPRPGRARRAAALALATALALGAGCGYRVVGIGGQLPGGVTRVEVPVFENRTTRAEIGRTLTEDFIRRLLGQGKVRVVKSEEAEAVIRGVVTSYKREPVSFDSKQTPLENRLTVVMDVDLTRRAGNKVLFAEKNVTVRFDYPVRTDLQANDKLEDEAIANVSDQMSQKLVTLMLEGF